MLLNGYFRFLKFIRRIRTWSIPYVRRFVRFLALPYCFFAQVTWEECPVSKSQVFSDMLYIFFRLKYYPDNYSLCRLWLVDRRDWRLYYGSISDPYQRGRLQREVQPPEYRIVFADKEICHHLCVAVGLPVPKALGTVTPDDDFRACIVNRLRETRDRRLIVKPARGTKGRGVHLVEEVNGIISVWSAGRQMALDNMKLRERSILEECVRQHIDLSRVYPSSVNTIRLQTLLCRDRDVIILGSLIRFGRNHSCVDNVNAGGIPVGVDLQTGRLQCQAFDMYNHRYERHPESGTIFDGYEIPFWTQAIALAKHAQACFPFYRMLGFDIAMTPDGPVIVEINPEPDTAFLEAISAPIFSRPRVLLEFERYGLLINKPSRVLAKAAHDQPEGKPSEDFLMSSPTVQNKSIPK